MSDDHPPVDTPAAICDAYLAHIMSDLRLLAGEIRLIRWMVSLTVVLMVPIAIAAISLLFKDAR